MKFCSECASPVSLLIPAGDNRPRYVCESCATIHYQNPKMVLGTIPVWERDGELKILLCKRAIEPRHGYWTLPAGFMENDETTAEAAMRETQEEAGANIELGKLFSLLNVARVHQVHMFYLATLLDLDFAPGEESLDVQMFSEAEIPWDDLAFPTIRTTLELFFADRARMREDQSTGYRFHAQDITRAMRSDAEPT
ncbi:ADP-ribose pyrophosphatase YjhB, NUDIX family [Duganella sp. CF517]|uniref:NUDIX hydrolase n=1 Tax=Duganella sp. CF517 TaxID=1881038 RepID=UPI0008C115F2|nr:NUDIX hydrolase [Duganella sp. CF517]SEO16398.1 ADP-ribose pyrophosphatase YjhB, NUDIX family [Duganella sp. CF517]